MYIISDHEIIYNIAGVRDNYNYIGIRDINISILSIYYIIILS